MKFSIFSSFFLFVSLQCLSQTYQISGKVHSENDTSGLPGVSVRLLSADGINNVSGNVTNSNGYFIISNISSGNYQLEFDYLGFQQIVMKVAIDNKDIFTGTTVLKLEPKQLKDLIIKEKQLTATQTGDTSEFNADAYKVNPDATAEDLIKKMPGITSDNTGIKANGEDVKQVLVDGKPFFGNDPSTALKNLPAEILDKVQVFDKLSDQGQFTGFDDGQSQKTINLITNPDKNTGEFGKIYAGYGTDDKYIAGLTYNKFDGDRRISIIEMSNNVNQQNFTIDDVMSVMSNSGSLGGGSGPEGPGSGPNDNKTNSGGIGGPGGLLVGQQSGITTTHSAGINYSDSWGEKIKFSGSYFFNYTDNTNNSDLTRSYFDSGMTYQQNSLTRTRNYNNRVNLRFEYAIDSFNALTITPQLRFQQNNYTTSLDAYNMTGDSVLSHTKNTQEANNKGYDLLNNILYKHKFHKRGRTISANIGSEINGKTGNGNYYSASQFTDNLSSTILNQKYSLVNNTYTLSGNISYTEPIGKRGQLMISYIPSLVNGKADKATDDLDSLTGKYTYPDRGLSNKYTDVYTTHATGITYSYSKGRMNFMAGTNFQYATLTGDQSFPYSEHTDKSFTSLLPMAMFNYKFSKTRNLHIIYHASANSPSVSQLQNVVNISNPLQPTTGNADLKQNYENSLVARYGVTNKTTGHNFFLFLMGNYIDNYIGNQTIVPIADTLFDGYTIQKGSQLTKPINLNGYTNAKTFVVYGLPVSAIKSNLNLNGGITFAHTPSLTNSTINFSNSYTANGGFYLGSNINQNVDLSLSYNGSCNIVKNSNLQQSNNAYYNHTAMFKVNWIAYKGLVVNTDVTHNLYHGLTQGYNENYILWNAYVGYKFLKNHALEAKISINDLLNQNRGISHTITDSYIEDSRTQVLKRYCMFTVTYTLRNFKHGVQPNNDFAPPLGLPPPGLPPPGMGGPPPMPPQGG